MIPRRPFWVRSAETASAMTQMEQWSYRALKRDFPGYMGLFSAYVLTLDAGGWPHDVHAHVDEEILIPLSGAVDMVEHGSVRRLTSSDLVLHAPWHEHTHVGAPSGPAALLAFKWAAPGSTGEGSSRQVEVANLDLEETEALRGIRRRRIWTRRPLTSGSTMTVESVQLQPSTGYPMHTHDHDLVLVVTAGQLVTFGVAIQAPAVIYYPAGTPHGGAAGSEPLRMIALDFHAAPAMPWLGAV